MRCAGAGLRRGCCIRRGIRLGVSAWGLKQEGRGPRWGREIAAPGILLAGDTLFQRSIGRTDLWGGSMPQILTSIREKLLVLPEETIVFPGHGDTTTIGEEKDQNRFLRA